MVTSTQTKIEFTVSITSGWFEIYKILMRSTVLFPKFMSKIYLERNIFLIVNENEYKWSKCISPQLSQTIFSISEAISLIFFFLGHISKALTVLKFLFAVFSIISKNVEKQSSWEFPVFP